MRHRNSLRHPPARQHVAVGGLRIPKQSRDEKRSGCLKHGIKASPNKLVAPNNATAASVSPAEMRDKTKLRETPKAGRYQPGTVTCPGAERTLGYGQNPHRYQCHGQSAARVPVLQAAGSTTKRFWVLAQRECLRYSLDYARKP